MIVEYLQDTDLLAGREISFHAVDLPQAARIGILESSPAFGSFAGLSEDLAAVEEDSVHRGPGRGRIESEGFQVPRNALRAVVESGVVEFFAGPDHRLAHRRRSSGR